MPVLKVEGGVKGESTKYYEGESDRDREIREEQAERKTRARGGRYRGQNTRKYGVEEGTDTDLALLNGILDILRRLGVALVIRDVTLWLLGLAGLGVVGLLRRVGLLHM